jgi:hypothetical protein
VTVIVGAKASNLEKGAKKVWGGLPKDAQVFNLEGGAAGIQGALSYLELLKRSMHEIMNIPETALGQVQPISNTSGVALSIQYQPLMNRWAQKTSQYGKGLEKINELALRTLFFKEPETMLYNPEVDGPIKEGQYPQLDPNDPISYQNYAQFPQPLPLDKLIVLNEIQTKLGMGLESKEGALRQLGEEFPEEKLNEIRDELVLDNRIEDLTKEDERSDIHVAIDFNTRAANAFVHYRYLMHPIQVVLINQSNVVTADVNCVISTNSKPPAATGWTQRGDEPALDLMLWMRQGQDSC